MPKKAMELLPLGPVVIIDTAGIDDTGKLGEMRAERARKVLDQTDIAVLVTEAGRDLLPAEQELVGLFKEKHIDYLIAFYIIGFARIFCVSINNIIVYIILCGELIRIIVQ
jgi:predicted GTPase